MWISDNRNRRNNFVISIFKFDSVRPIWECIVLKHWDVEINFIATNFVNTKAQNYAMEFELKRFPFTRFFTPLRRIVFLVAHNPPPLAVRLEFDGRCYWKLQHMNMKIKRSAKNKCNCKFPNLFDENGNQFEILLRERSNCILYGNKGEMHVSFRFNFLIADISFNVCNWIELEVQWAPITNESFPFHGKHDLYIFCVCLYWCMCAIVHVGIFVYSLYCSNERWFWILIPIYL